MTRHRTALALLAALLVAVNASAQEQTESIEPDRPDVTNGTHIVETGLLQIEIGGLFTRPIVGQHSAGSPFTARVGLFEWLEARVGTDGLLFLNDGTKVVSGFGNVQIGAKLRLWADPGGVPVLSILPTINLPTASAEKGFGSGSADYTLAMLTGTDIGRHGHVDVNYGIGLIGAGVDEPHFVQHLISVSGSAAVTENWNPYAEAFWYSRQDADGSGVPAFDVGAIYQMGNRFALDGGVQIGLNKSAPDFAAFGGVSIIIGDVLGSHGPEARHRRQERARARSSTSK